jgi:hypothetical protein
MEVRMFDKRILAAFLALSLATLACGININLPEEVKTGPIVTDEISVAAPDFPGPIELYLGFGAGELELEPGAENALVSGTAIYNVPDFKPEVKTDGDEVHIEQGKLNVGGIPNFEDQVDNEWDLKLSNEPMELYISAGAYNGRYELGGLSLYRLEISDGAAKVDVSFSEPNQIEMRSFNYSTGASDVTLEDLGNANLSTMTFRSGAGSYRLDFSGALQRDMEVLIESGISSIVIVIPEGVPATVGFEGGLSNIDTWGEWEQDGSGYTQPGEGYKIEIRVKMGAGNLELRNK